MRVAVRSVRLDAFGNVAVMIAYWVERQDGYLVFVAKLRNLRIEDSGMYQTRWGQMQLGEQMAYLEDFQRYAEANLPL